LPNGGFPAFVGRSADLLRDAQGKALGQALLDAGSKGDGSVRYQWVNPVTQKTEPKISFVQKAGDDVCLVGACAP
jgi:signal transduction histidine kinase